MHLCQCFWIEEVHTHTHTHIIYKCRHMCCYWWSSALFLAWVWMSLIENHHSSLNSSLCPEPSSTGFNEEISADSFCFYCIFNCWWENSGKDLDVSWIPNITGHWSIIKQTAGLNGMDLTQRLPIFQNITCDHFLNRLDDTFSAKHTPGNGTVILQFALFLEKNQRANFQNFQPS